MPQTSLFRPCYCLQLYNTFELSILSERKMSEVGKGIMSSNIVIANLNQLTGKNFIQWGLLARIWMDHTVRTTCQCSELNQTQRNQETLVLSYAESTVSHFAFESCIHQMSTLLACFHCCLSSLSKVFLIEQEYCNSIC